MRVLTRSWLSVVLREWIMSERWEARSRRSLMGMAVHAATVYNTGTETEEPWERMQAQIKVSKKKKMDLVRNMWATWTKKWEWKHLVKACDPFLRAILWSDLRKWMHKGWNHEETDAALQIPCTTRHQGCYKGFISCFFRTGSQLIHINDSQRGGLL